jgi:hypothetical protein
VDQTLRCVASMPQGFLWSPLEWNMGGQGRGNNEVGQGLNFNSEPAQGLPESRVVLGIEKIM